jgi:L,D-peptidoglycan transpeptidase YkuD (ErfK/YbiS/YcfS/YnhG family)
VVAAGSAGAASNHAANPPDRPRRRLVDRRYNRAFRTSAIEPGDRLWREDCLYDVIIEIDHNMRPRVAGRGSAVFIHVARPGFAPTAGCVALKPRELRMLAQKLSPKTRIMIHN